MRIGIHSGYPKLADANYIGMAVHTAARVSAAAHGGQILVSGDTREAAKGLSPDGVRFRRLGEFRLRGAPGAGRRSTRSRRRVSAPAFRPHARRWTCRCHDVGGIN